MKIADILSAIAGFLLSAAIIATVIDVVSFDRSFYEAEYRKNDTVSYTGMSAEDNLRATDTLLDYLQDKRQDIVCTAVVSGTEREVFNERETLHMVDVKALYQNAIRVRNGCVITAVILLVLSVLNGKKSFFSVLRSGWKNGILLTGAVILFIAIWALADFNQFWTNFHLLFFDNDLWLLDPNTSIMINLFPGSFFFDLVTRIIAWVVGIHVVISGILFGTRKVLP
ncbi:MAG: TIGR01906 family membrane protein [Solobacterium sp.]|jgi:integral membrane protein (TIGR01906 family)|nr:TIGR01906 family membrane protein [Solobacterium sp.]